MKRFKRIALFISALLLMVGTWAYAETGDTASDPMTLSGGSMYFDW